MVVATPSQRVSLTDIQEFLKKHEDKREEIDDIPYLKNYEQILNNKNQLEAIEFFESLAHGYYLLSSFKKCLPCLERALSFKEKVYGKNRFRGFICLLGVFRDIL